MLIEKIYGCKNNPENPSTTKVGEHIPLICSMNTIPSFKNIGKDCMKKFCKSLREHAIKIIDFFLKNEVINKIQQESLKM